MRADATRVIRALIASAIFCCGAAHAEDCKPLKLLNRIQMVPGEEGTWRVPVSINGQEKFMLLWLNSNSSFINRKAVKLLELPMQHGNLLIKDLEGNVSTDVTRVRDFKFGYVQANDRWFAVAPDPNAGIEQTVGQLSRDMLFGYDVDIDFGTGLLSLFAPEHCADKVGYWVEPPPGTDITFKDAFVSFPVAVEGMDFTAVLSTNGYSTMTQDVARKQFGIEPKPGELAPVPGTSPTSPISGYFHTFAAISFGGVTVKNMRVLIVQDALNKPGEQSSGDHASSFRTVRLPHLIIGMNVLKYLHINIATRTSKIYVSAASPATK